MKKAIAASLLGLYLLASPIKSLSQTVSGYITDLFDNQPVPQAVVTVSGLGSGITNDEGFYAVGDTTNIVEFPYVITPRKTSKVDVFNNIGQKVGSLDNLIEGSNIDLSSVSKGIYFLRHFDDRGDIIGHTGISNINGNYPAALSVPDRIAENNSGRKINSPMDYSDVTITKEGFYDRLTFIDSPESNVEFNEGLIPVNDSFLEHMNTVLGRNEIYGSVRWPENVDPMFKIWPYFIGNNQPVSQTEIDKVITAIDTIASYSDELFNGNITGQYEIVDSLIAVQNAIYMYWDSSIPFNSGVIINSNNQTNEVYNASIRFKFEGLPQNIFLAEGIKTVTASQLDSDVITPSIFNFSPVIDYLTQDDKNIIKANNSRAPNWKSPDKTTY